MQSTSSRKYYGYTLLGIIFVIVTFVLSIGKPTLPSFREYLLRNNRSRLLVNEHSAGNISSITSAKKSDKRGYIALVYSGTARSFTVNFESHIVNLMAGCPFTVHLFFHTYMNDNRFPGSTSNPSETNYVSLNATLGYFRGYVNLDNEDVLFRDIVKGNTLEHLPLSVLRQIYNSTYDTALAYNPDHPPMSNVYYMWHSQRRAEELRQNYMATTGINYKWVFRMRLDAVFYTNWWQQAFDIEVYSYVNRKHKGIKHDVSADWGIRPTRLYDLVYKPKLQEKHTLYVPKGWGYHGYNDQFAAMSSTNAKHYFTRILTCDRMLREDRLDPESSIRLVAKWNNLTVNTAKGSICYDIVRTPSEIGNEASINNQRNRSCQFKGSGKQDCKMLCPGAEKINKALRDRFNGGLRFERRNATTTGAYLKSLLLRYLTSLNTQTAPVNPDVSSFYYFYRYIVPDEKKDSCLPRRGSTQQPSTYASQHLSFIIRTTNHEAIRLYNKYLSCGPAIDITS